VWPLLALSVVEAIALSRLGRAPPAQVPAFNRDIHTTRPECRTHASCLWGSGKTFVSEPRAPCLDNPRVPRLFRWGNLGGVPPRSGRYHRDCPGQAVISARRTGPRRMLRAVTRYVPRRLRTLVLPQHAGRRVNVPGVVATSGRLTNALTRCGRTPVILGCRAAGVGGSLRCMRASPVGDPPTVWPRNKRTIKSISEMHKLRKDHS